MSSLQEVTAIQILEEALDAGEYGIEIEISSREPIVGITSRAKGILYKVKKDIPRFRNLVIKFSPFDPDSKLWIYTGDEKREPQQSEPSNSVNFSLKGMDL